MRNVSLVAFYGDKPVGLASLIQQLQAYLFNHPLLQNKFIPYQLKQVHSTLIGCEGWQTSQGVINQWFQEKRQETKYIDFWGLTNYLQNQVNFPLTIRFAGYERQQNYNFLSRHQHPRDRSFQLQSVAQDIIPVLIGWSWQDDAVTLAIDNFRREFQHFNLLHKYHGNPDDLDNDFYLRLGTIKAKLTLSESQTISTEILNLLEVQPSLYISINLENLAFVQYQDLSLTPKNTKVIPVQEIDPFTLEQLYSSL